MSLWAADGFHRQQSNSKKKREKKVKNYRNVNLFWITFGRRCHQAAQHIYSTHLVVVMDWFPLSAEEDFQLNNELMLTLMSVSHVNFAPRCVTFVSSSDTNAFKTTRVQRIIWRIKKRQSETSLSWCPTYRWGCVPLQLHKSLNFSLRMRGDMWHLRKSFPNFLWMISVLVWVRKQLEEEIKAYSSLWIWLQTDHSTAFSELTVRTSNPLM